MRTRREFTLEEAKTVWLISDTHFDHMNIIRYCNRPFQTVEEMNETIFHNWNETVSPGDTVYFLGDLVFGRGSKKPRWWIARLHGKIVWMKGSHDHGIRPTSIMPGVRVVISEEVSVGGISFLLVHNTSNADMQGWDGWVIHGHTHDTQPFINVPRRRVNVSVEVLGYRPISLLEILQWIQDPALVVSSVRGKEGGDR